MTALDLACFLLAVLTAACITLTAYAWHEHAAATRQRIRAEELATWADLYQSEADAARRRLHVMERRYTTLQTLHVDASRRLLARNFAIEFERKRRRGVWIN